MVFPEEGVKALSELPNLRELRLFCLPEGFPTDLVSDDATLAEVLEFLDENLPQLDLNQYESSSFRLGNCFGNVNLSEEALNTLVSRGIRPSRDSFLEAYATFGYDIASSSLLFTCIWSSNHIYTFTGYIKKLPIA